jgi:type VI secretion system secreted protein Hcp
VLWGERVTIDYFLKIDGIPGESQDTKHKGEIEVEAWSWGETATVPTSAGAGGGAGKVTIQPLTFTSRISKASPLLMMACASGRHIKNALLTARRGGKGQVEFLTIALEDVLASSYQTAGGAEDGSPLLDSVSLNFRTIRVEYRETKPDGTVGTPVIFAWDAQRNVGV